MDDVVIGLVIGLFIGLIVVGGMISSGQSPGQIETACRERGLLIVDKNVYQCRLLIRDGVAQQ